MTDTLAAGEALAASVAKTPNRVTLEHIKGKVRCSVFINPDFKPELTVAIVELENGFVVIGKSAPADPANFDEQAGREFALADALREVWSLEGYLLRERLHQEAAG